MTISLDRKHFIIATACLMALGGCTTRGSAVNVANNTNVQRAQDQAVQNEMAAKPDADDRGTHLRLIGQMQEKGIFFASLAHIDAFEQRWGASPESSVLRADALRQTAQPDAAKVLYGQLMNTSQKARAAHGLGLLAGRAGDLSTATSFLAQASQIAPTDANVLNDLGFVMLQQGRWQEARLPLMKASELDSGNTRVWSNVALYLTLEGQAEQAQSVMNEHKLPVATRTQIADLARGIQQKSQPAGKPVAAVVPVAPIGAAPVATATQIAETALSAAPAVTVPSAAVPRIVTVVAPPLPPAPVALAPALPVARVATSIQTPAAVSTAPVTLRDIGVADVTSLPSMASQDVSR